MPHICFHSSISQISTARRLNSEEMLARRLSGLIPDSYVLKPVSPPLLCRPELFDWSSVEKKMSAIDRLEHAFSKAEQHLGIERLLDPEGN